MTQLEWPLVREVSIYYKLELITLEIKFATIRDIFKLVIFFQ